MKLFKTSKEGLRVLFVASECAPFAKIGGLGSVMQSLPRALRSIGHDARIMIPRYLSISDDSDEIKMEHEGLEVPTDNEEGPEQLICNVKVYDKQSISEDTPVYFLENEEYYEQRANIYGYADDPIRWALLSRGVLEFLRISKWVPDVIVANDWQTGFLVNYLKVNYKDDPILSKISVVFSIHNLVHQGMFDHNFVQEMDFDDGHSAIPGFNNPRLLNINGMRRGIMYADAISTVSPTYAKEIMTEGYGESLEDLLKEKRSLLKGILNGVDYKKWDPKTDPHIEKNYSASSIAARDKNKQVLQERFNLPTEKNNFLLSYVGRMDGQKGIDMIFPIAETLFSESPIQLIVVGEGDSGIMKAFHELEKKYPKQVAVHLKFDPVLPNIVFAGSDATLVPSRFEPSGLIQMEAMRFGSIPIARKTGGLADTVFDYDPRLDTGTGFSFVKADSSSLLVAIIRAMETYRHKDIWRLLQKRVMKQDFSWEHSAEEYSDLFNRAIEIHKRS